MKEELVRALTEHGVGELLISDAIDSGYFLRNWIVPGSLQSYTSVSDAFYGNKQFSSSFPIAQFAAYLKGEYRFQKLPDPPRYLVRNLSDIHEILSDSRRAHYISEGSLTFRGQPKEYYVKRKISNPVRRNENGLELSILPSAYRSPPPVYSFEHKPKASLQIRSILSLLEPENPDVHRDGAFSHDPMRVEQHYGLQTAGLDLTFDLSVALFFATQRFIMNETGRAYYASTGPEATGRVVYCFRFGSPPVTESAYRIRNFNLFKTYPPTRVLRQKCGLPLFDPYERNIAVTDIDCVIELAHDFECSEMPRASYLFPSKDEDRFYGTLLELKARHPKLLNEIVEYLEPINYAPDA